MRMSLWWGSCVSTKHSGIWRSFFLEHHGVQCNASVQTRHLKLAVRWLYILDYSSCEYQWVNFIDKTSGLIKVRTVRSSVSLGSQPAPSLPPLSYVTRTIWVAVWHVGQSSGTRTQHTELELGHDAGWGSRYAAFPHQTGSKTRYNWAYGLKAAEPTAASGITQVIYLLLTNFMTLDSKDLFVHQFSYLENQLLRSCDSKILSKSKTVWENVFFGKLALLLLSALVFFKVLDNRFCDYFLCLFPLASYVEKLNLEVQGFSGSFLFPFRKRH